MSAVSVRQDGPKLHVASPYHADFVAGAKKIGGRWSPEEKTWTVPLAEAGALRELLIRVYKTDGGLPAPTAKPAGSRIPTLAEADAILARLVVGWAPAAEASAP